MTPNLSSKKCLNHSVISGILENDKVVEKLADSNESELSNTEESNESDFLDKED
jgi:succinate dehydrogenase flavin-adding protein (antitoxin of CptAB toxin-antitoxin module)